jgi:glycosyltransferase involved in cell wall biosynthesis
MKISVVVLARNEAEVLPGALATVALADEVIVGVDDSTTDDTAEVARSLGAQVVSVSLAGGFAQAKNELIAMGANEWVFVLDADERLEETLQAEIRSLNAPSGVDGYKIRSRNFALGRELKHGGWQNSDPVRLIRRGSASYQGTVHEEMVVAGTVEKLDGAMLHYSHRSVSQLIDKINLYSSLEADRVASARGGLRGLVLPAVAQFARIYWRESGYRDGSVGLIEAACAALTVFLTNAKAWERTRG